MHRLPVGRARIATCVRRTWRSQCPKWRGDRVHSGAMTPASGSARAAMVSWRLLRPDPVDIAGEPIRLTSRPRAVLYRLLLEPNRPVTSDQIAQFIWGDAPPKAASNSVARFVSDLRVAFGPLRDRIVTTSNGYHVVVLAGELDIDVARGILDESRRWEIVDPERSHLLLASGLDLVGDGPNPIWATLPASGYHSREHDELRLALLEQHFDVQLRRQRHREVVAELEAAVTRHPFHEGLWARLMTALGRSGRATEALRAGRRARSALSDAGLVIGEPLRRIESELASGVFGDASDSDVTDGLPGSTFSTYGITEPRNPLIGRTEALNRLDAAVRDHRLVSVVGLGGVGKTRVALAVVRPREQAGTTVHRVGLRGVSDPRLVASTIATVIGIPSSAQLVNPDTLAHAARHDSFLLVLDNCEHLAGACRAVLVALLDKAPGVRIITTSRVALDVPGEHVFSLGMLAVPVAGTSASASVTLFLDRARQHLPTGLVSDGDLQCAASIAQSLGGHPLALELAAAQLVDITLQALSERIDASPRDPFSEQDPAAKSLDDLMNSTWDHLPASQQSLLARLSVFRGGWTIDAADIVCSDGPTVATDMAGLIGRGLVTPVTSQGTVRYEMLDPVRGFAEGRLADRSATVVFHDRLTTWIIGLAAHWEIADGHVIAEATVDLLAERDNLVIALHHLDRAGRAEELAWLAVRSSSMWVNHGFAQEVIRWLSPAVDDESLSRQVRSAAAAMLLSASHSLGLLDDLTRLAMRSIEFADGEAHDWIPAVAAFMGMWSMLSPAPMTSDEFNDLARTVAEQSPSARSNLAICSLYRAHLEFGLRRYEAAAELFEQALTLTRLPGRLLLVAEVGYGLATYMTGRHDDAVANVATWRSRADTDEWHYIIDLYRAIIIGGAGQAERATVELAGRVRLLRSASIWGRADEIQTAFGLLAGFRGELDLSVELLSTTTNRDILLLGITIEHVAGQRGVVDDAGWFEIAQEFATRVLPVEDDDALPRSTTAQVTWWSGAAVG